MKQLFILVFILVRLVLYSQEEMVHSSYFEFDKFNLDNKQVNDILHFVKTIDTGRVETISIYGYCDDRGKDEYNYILSNKRAGTIKDILVKSGVRNKIIVTIEGKGRILIDDDIIDNLPKVRSKNRRVDIVINLKEPPKIVLDIPGVYTTIQKKHVVGDRILLENLFFDRGSSKLTVQSKNELDKIAKLLIKYKTLSFEIQGHVCCTPKFQKEAIDKDTKKRELSKNRAVTVYKYLLLKKIGKNRMTFKGYGTSKPLGKGSQYDRRVELVITKI